MAAAPMGQQLGQEGESQWLGRAAIRAQAVRPLILLDCALPVLLATGVVFAPLYPVALVFAGLNGVAFAPLSVLVGVHVARHTPPTPAGADQQRVVVLQ